jgi:hypothetical protein
MSILWLAVVIHLTRDRVDVTHDRRSDDDRRFHRAGRWTAGHDVAGALLAVSDIEAKLAEVTAAGATVREPAHDVGGGRLVATVSHAEGNVLGLLQDQ